MHIPTIYDPSQDDSLGSLRGGGRIVSILKQNLEKDVRFITNLQKVDQKDTLLVPLWRPFQKPLLNQRLAQKQLLMLYDVIPLKYPQYFPVGLKGRWRIMQNIHSLKIYDGIITISEHSKKDIIDYLQVSPDIIDVVYPTTNQLYFTPQPRKTTLSKSDLIKKYNLPRGEYAIYVGDTNWNKNLVNIAYAVMKSKIPCVFVGKTFELISKLRAMDQEERQDFFSNSPVINHQEQREFKEFIKLSIHDDAHFIFPGFVPDKHMVYMYRHAVCNLFVSQDEGFGLSYLEAATQKCPSVLAKTDIFKETAGDAALFANPDEPEKIALQILKFFKQKKTRVKLGKAAFVRSKKYAPAVFRKNMLTVLTS